MGRHILVTIATVFLPICLSAYLFVHASPSLLPHSFLDPHLSLWYGRSQCIFTIFGAALYEPKQESAAAVIRQPHRRTRSACSDNNPNPNNRKRHDIFKTIMVCKTRHDTGWRHSQTRVSHQTRYTTVVDTRYIYMRHDTRHDSNTHDGFRDYKTPDRRHTDIPDNASHQTMCHYPTHDTSARDTTQTDTHRHDSASHQTKHTSRTRGTRHDTRQASSRQDGL